MCPLAWWGGDGAERGGSSAQDSRVLAWDCTWVGCPGDKCGSLWVPRHSRNSGRNMELDKVLTSPGGRCTVHKQSPHGSCT